MKHAKKLLVTKLLALLLALLLGTGLSAPAFAQDGEVFAQAVPIFPQEEPEEELSAVPVITVQPQAPSGRVPRDGSFTLLVEAHIPNGDPAGYRWIRTAVQRAGPAADTESWDGGAEITLPVHSKTSEYYCVVYNLNRGFGSLETRVESDKVIPLRELPVLRKIADALLVPLYLVTRLFGLGDEEVLGTIFRIIFAIPIIVAVPLGISVIGAPAALLLLFIVGSAVSWLGLDDYFQRLD